jgi:hypothetical protein
MQAVIKNKITGQKSRPIDVSYDDYTNREDIKELVAEAMNLFDIKDYEINFYED